jgi:hypothetical protein
MKEEVSILQRAHCTSQRTTNLRTYRYVPSLVVQQCNATSSKPRKEEALAGEQVGNRKR